MLRIFRSPNSEESSIEFIDHVVELFIDLDNGDVMYRRKGRIRKYKIKQEITEVLTRKGNPKTLEFIWDKEDGYIHLSFKRKVTLEIEDGICWIGI